MKFLGIFHVIFEFWSQNKIFSFGRKYFTIELNFCVKNSEERSIKVFIKVWAIFKLKYFEDDFYICAYRYLKKRQKEKINFNELPKNKL